MTSELGTIWGQKATEHKMCVSILTTILSQILLILRRNLLSQMYIGVHIKYPLIVSYFNETGIFWTYFPKIF